MKTKTGKNQVAKKAAPQKAAAKKAVAKKTSTGKTKKAAAPKSVAKNVTFTIHADKGKSVFLAGEFNKWDPTAKKMSYKAASGIYTATIKLEPGTYQYKFVLDGTWCADPENVNAVANDHGTFNSLITVK